MIARVSLVAINSATYITHIGYCFHMGKAGTLYLYSLKKKKTNPQKISLSWCLIGGWSPRLRLWINMLLCFFTYLTVLKCLVSAGNGYITSLHPTCLRRIRARRLRKQNQHPQDPWGDGGGFIHNTGLIFSDPNSCVVCTFL